MYEYIKGTIDSVCPDYVVVDNQGIGYQILTPNPFVFTKNIGKVCKIYTYQHVREDMIALFGFETAEEKMLFKKLLNVSGIGPKGALAILAYGQPAQVIEAIENENESFLTKFPGVGKKTARQMILDLKGKLLDIVSDLPDLFNQEQTALKAETNRNLEEAMLALQALGYSEKEIGKVSAGLQQEGLSTDEYIKLALKAMVK
ncbi:Holliday junction branch migration protein RuvA [Heyndrickxia acidiproducens]|uniref:Holliday junction branch migration protein RuvA n=1 Tax=Heyndrickxia acidiproducens TaxID=1121084 RepID=UPI0003827917|nr:Holliday junction branch migration protein RuvA [Heyndrickxia acidiproducens]